MSAIRQMLSMVLEQQAQELELQPRQYGVLVSPRVDRELLGDASFIIAARADCDAEELRLRLPSHLKVGSVERIRELVSLHLPGLRMRPLPVAPRQIPFTLPRPISFSMSMTGNRAGSISQEDSLSMCQVNFPGSNCSSGQSEIEQGGGYAKRS